jgi:hypothetical protein
VRVKIDKAEEQIPKITAEQSLEQLLSQDDALRLAKETALKSREVQERDLDELYEKVVLDEISIPEFLNFIRNSVKEPAYSNVLKEISLNIGRFK